MKTDIVCQVKNLSKSYASKKVVNNLNLEIKRGSLYAFLGPNGAGKTTSLRMIAGLLKPDSGMILIEGVNMLENPSRAKKPMAYLPDEPMLYGKLTPMEYLEFVAALWEMNVDDAQTKAEGLLQSLGLWDHRNQWLEEYSRGMKQKVALAGALIHSPRLLLMDEPLTGLDAHAARGVKDLLIDFVGIGGTVIMTTHILEVAERLSERIGIIHHGQLVMEGSLYELQRRSGQVGGTLEDVFLKVVGSAGSVQ